MFNDLSLALVPDAASTASADLAADPQGALAQAGVPPRVERFILAHRHDGHRHAALDPLGAAPPLDLHGLSPAQFGLSPGDPVTVDGSGWLGARQVDELDRRLKAAYCGPLALDASAVRDATRRDWLHARMEASAATSARAGLPLLDRLIRAETWEQHVAGRYPDAKRFSLEGHEALVPLLDALIEEAAVHGVTDVFMGMSHRGRVNVLVNVLGMPPADLLDHFDPNAAQPELHTDLAYHLGAARSVGTPHGDVAVTLACNPSHLQSVYPVVVGMTHACQTRTSPGRPRRAMALVLHGDAAFAGQGVVMETLAMAHKPGYAVGGTVHVVVNNQVGFTEPNLMDSQQARYCTDVTRMADAPVLRVNADAPEQVLRAAEIAVAYRTAFASDVVIDLIGYRRLGHSEHDLPMLTNPRGCATSRANPTVVDLYGAHLVADGHAPEADVLAYMAARRAAAVAAFERTTRRAERAVPDAPAGVEAPFSRQALQAAVAAMTRLPQGFEPHAQIRAQIDRWQGVANGSLPTGDWCFAENMAYASVLSAGVDVRVSGLDVRRGTFMHRHAAWHDQSAPLGRDEAIIPLRQLETTARFDVVNSVLSEEAVVGFEYGHSVQASQALTVWEAQFGDFVNGAQVYVDQYISAGEDKWGTRSALAMLLPHGHEGVGPEHSNAHLGRFLANCGGGNMRVAFPSTAAQMFHLLRRQAFSAVRKPLVVMTPKGTLYKEAASHSPLADFLGGAFEPVLDDATASAPERVTRLVLSSGKLHYGLHHAREQAGLADVALVRIEELYPFPTDVLARVLARYPGLRTVVWAQEENLHHGAWSFVRDDLADACPSGARLSCVSRPNTASGATSSYAVHGRQQRELIERALGLDAPA